MASETEIVRIMTWNIRQGGSDRVPGIVGFLSHTRPDVVVLTEYQPSADSGDRLRNALRCNGWEHQEALPQPAVRNAVLVASRTPLVRVDEDLPFDLPADQLPYAWARWVEVLVPGWTVAAPDPLADPVPLTVAGVHVPGDTDKPGLAGKVAFWDALLAWATRRSVLPTIVLGDFNSGLEIDEGKPKVLTCKEHVRRLRDELGWCDAWRSQHEEVREYTYYHYSRNHVNGFRLDHAWLSPAVPRWRYSSAHHHGVRAVHRLSDHSALSIEVEVERHAARVQRRT